MHTASSLFTLLALASRTLARVQYVGVAIPGIDFGCDIDGSCPIGDNVEFPLKQYGGGDGAAQMKHFVKNDEMNVFRLPTSWQWIVNNELGDLDETNWGKYDDLVQACLDTGAYCMIDLHNFARYDGGIIGQGGPSDDVFVDLWKQITHKYADEDRIIFGLMNEPHDVDIKIWAATCQKAVTAIRKAGATSQMILLPGTNFASAETFVSTGSAEALAAISNPDGSKDGLILDVHKYLDINNSGTYTECTTDNVKAFEELASWLRKNKRKCMISESGASLDESCIEKFCAQNKAISDNSDVYIGFVAWGAGSFESDYILNLSPSGSPGDYTDNKLMKECVIKPFIEDGGPLTTSSSTKTKTKTIATKTKTADADETTTATMAQNSAKSTDRVFKEEDPSSESASATETGASKASSTADKDNAGYARSVQTLTGGLMLGAALFFLGA
ncbi:glycoside hydrolase superfamily [Thelonectria olida]|uniref:Endoglucanase EG-II n=1 Tax=Thelonectria olida TaxID=1576542 RepID=A0A9P9AQA8_9HYPO|nr:glycoside hydrolase superfamily [Thelonectria olida]